MYDRIMKAERDGPFHVFISAGRRFADSDAPLGDTIPDWLYGSHYTQKPDIVLIEGWEPGMPIPLPNA